LIARGRQAG